MATIRTSDGVEVHYTVRGDKGAAPVVFLHGFPLTSALWEGVAERLPAGAALSILPDLRGHGRTPLAADRPGGAGHAAPSLSRYARDIADLLDARGEGRPVTIVGLSMGGYIALEFWRLFRGRVGALVLADTRASADTEQAARGREIQAHAVLRENSAATLAEGMMPKLFAAGAAPALRDRWRGIIGGASPEGVAYALRAMAARPDSTPTLGAIDIPTLIIVGDEDQITPPEVARAMHAAIPGSTLEIIPGAGHMAPVEQPDRFADVLASFLGRERGPSGRVQ